MRREEFDDSAHFLRARGQLLECRLAAEGCQAPENLIDLQWRALPQSRWHRGGNDLAYGMAIVVSRPFQQLEQTSIECRFGIHHAVRRAQFCRWHLAAIAMLNHDSNDTPPPE